MNVIKQVDAKIDSVLKTVFHPSLAMTLIHVLLIAYASKIAPSPPKVVLDLFENIYFKLFVFSLILWTAQVSPVTSILIALAFLVTINYTTTGKLWETLANTSGPAVITSSSGQQAVVVPVAAPTTAPTTAPTLEDESVDSGCYPLRSYDMTQVSGSKDSSEISFEDYQEFNSTL